MRAACLWLVTSICVCIDYVCVELRECVEHNCNLVTVKTNSCQSSSVLVRSGLSPSTVFSNISECKNLLVNLIGVIFKFNLRILKYLHLNWATL